MRAESTPGARGPVFCGVDTHADSHWLCVLDWRGRKVLSRQFPADAAGYEALAGAIAAAGEPACVAMEGTSSYGAGLTRHLASLGMPVREALSPARMQRRRPGQGKCDEADAERAARAAMSGSRLGTPKSQDGWVDGVRCMLAARSGAVKARTSAINTARSLLTTAPEGLRSRFRGMGGPRLMEELPSVRAEGALGAKHKELIALAIGKLNPFIGFLVGIKAFTAAVLGGIGSIPGAMLGGILLGVAETFAAAYISSEYKDIVAFGLLVLILLFRPTGLLGKPEVEKV